MTVASGTLMVVGFASLNVIWGYPWLGIFSACTSLLVFGRVVSYLMKPKLAFHLTLPRSVAAENPLPVAISLLNQGRFPAMNFAIHFKPSKKATRRSLSNQSSEAIDYKIISSPAPISLLESKKAKRISSTLRFSRRGTVRIPPILTKSYFPFHLYETENSSSLQTQITVTPRPLSSDQNEAARGFLESMGQWSHRLLAGDTLDYTGSREYEVGMPVRRWDFNSWARLGKPIVREYQSPSVQQVFLLIDTSRPEHSLYDQRTIDLEFEHLLSAAASTIIELSKKRVRLKIFVTSEMRDHFVDGDFLNADAESMLIQLADVSPISTSTSDEQLRQAFDSIHRSPALVLSTRSADQYPDSISSAINWIRTSKDAEDDTEKKKPNSARQRPSPRPRPAAI